MSTAFSTVNTQNRENIIKESRGKLGCCTLSVNETQSSPPFHMQEWFKMDLSSTQSVLKIPQGCHSYLFQQPLYIDLKPS